MYKLPESFDGKFLVGRVFEQVCFNQNQIYLHFDSDVHIIIESSFSHQYSEFEKDYKVINVPVLESDIMQLLGSSILKVCGDKEGTLCLFFDNGHILRCYDNSTQYESYQIQHGKTLIIV